VKTREFDGCCVQVSTIRIATFAFLSNLRFFVTSLLTYLALCYMASVVTFSSGFKDECVKIFTF